jgi:lysozyme family protein
MLYSRITSQVIANKIFDLGVLFGVHVAVVLMQEVLQPHFPTLTIDGIFGSGTLDAVNGADPASLLVAYKAAFVGRAAKAGAEHPEERQFVAGWIRRINS